jgi:hypothetical protein
MATTVLIGNLQIKVIAHKTDQGMLVFSPFGFWIWTTAGYLPPVAEYWRKRQEGAWAWQIDNPGKVHILLYQGENLVGAVSDFKRDNLEKGIGGGFWILKQGETEYAGNFNGVGIGYEYS